MDIELPLDFKEFLKLLSENDVKYLLIGGYAVGYLGYPRTTNDMDVWIAIHPENAQRVINTLREFGFDHPDLTAELFLQQNKIIRMGHPPIRLEIAQTKKGGDSLIDFAIEITIMESIRSDDPIAPIGRLCC